MDGAWFAVAATLGAGLAVFAGWSYLGRHRLGVRVLELQRELDTRTTELESARLQLLRQSTEDPLTAVANHGQFLEFLEREWRRARRDGLPVSLIFLDIDHFRAFNREFGRRSGDDVLRQVGRAMAAVVGRPGDLVARYHRDEFALVLAATDGPGAVALAERLRQTVEGMRVKAASDAPAEFVTVSVAAATAVPQRESAWEELDLIKAARYALREARSAGGNRVIRASPGAVGAPVLVSNA